MKKPLLRVTAQLSILFCLLSCALSAQVPQTSLYTFQLERDDTLRWHIHSAKFLSAWNAGGYTNQPEWVDDHRLLVSSRTTGASQNDIYLLDLNKKTRVRLTDTPESEFSPLVIPGQKSFSVVRQVHGDEMDQQVYQFPLDLSSGGQSVLSSVLNVGYHCWLDQSHLALFLVDEPPKLAFISTQEKTPRIFSSMIGRCLRRTSDDRLGYVHKYSDDFWYLKVMHPETRRSEILIETLQGREDFAIGPTGCYFMGSGSVLYVFDPAAEPANWRPVMDLAIFGVSNITRLAINEDNAIALVDQKTE